jgi:hypothetical protein
LDRSKGRLNHKIGGNWWVEARIFWVFLTGPLLADQKYFADGEAFFGKDAWKSAFFISLLPSKAKGQAFQANRAFWGESHLLPDARMAMFLGRAVYALEPHLSIVPGQI